jgi:hypothetical protein
LDTSRKWTLTHGTSRTLLVDDEKIWKTIEDIVVRDL